MSNYLFVVNEVGNKSSMDIFDRLAEEKKWFFTENAPKWRNIEDGDKIIFYLAGKGYRCFAGYAVAGGRVEEVEDSDRKLLDEMALFGFSRKMDLKKVTVWKKTKDIRDLIPHLDFITEKKNYGLHLRQGVKLISDSDAKKIIGTKN